MMVGLKGGLTIGSSLLTSIIGAYGYITKEAAEVSGIAQELITQPESAIEGTRMLVSIYPSIPFLIGCGSLLYPFAIGSITTLSRPMLNLKIALLVPSKHSSAALDCTDIKSAIEISNIVYFFKFIFYLGIYRKFLLILGK